MEEPNEVFVGTGYPPNNLIKQDGNGNYYLNIQLPPKELPEYTWQNIPLYNTDTLIRLLVRKAEEEDYVPDVTEAKTLICKYLEDNFDSQLDSDYNEPPDLPALPWPQGSKLEGNRISDNIISIVEKEYEYEPSVIAKGNGKMFDEITSEDDGLSKILEKLFFKMKISDRLELSEWILANWKDIRQFSDIYEKTYSRLVAIALEKWMLKEDEIPELDRLRYGTKLVKFINEEISESDIFLSNDFNWRFSGTHDIFTWYVVKQVSLIIYALISENYDEKVVKDVLSKIVRNGTDETIIQKTNELREMIIKASLPEAFDESTKSRLETMVRLLLEIPNSAKVFPSLNDLYSDPQTNYDNYEIGKNMLNSYLDLFDATLKKYNIPNEVEILDMGCGTGDMLIGLSEKGYTNLWGLDSNRDFINKAQEKANDYPQIKEHFLHENWYDLSNLHKPGIFRVIYSLGRSLPHTETETNFRKVINEVSETLNIGDLFIFDMPDPTCGSYLQNIESYRNSLRKFGFNQIYINHMNYIVDCPDMHKPESERHYYNRYVPPRESVEFYLKNIGFEILETLYLDIPNGHNDKSMVFICRKKEIVPVLSSGFHTISS